VHRLYQTISVKLHVKCTNILEGYSTLVDTIITKLPKSGTFSLVQMFTLLWKYDQSQKTI